MEEKKGEARKKKIKGENQTVEWPVWLSRFIVFDVQKRKREEADERDEKKKYIYR